MDRRDSTSEADAAQATERSDTRHRHGTERQTERPEDTEAVRAAKALDYLANERTLLAWARLAVTVIVLGFVVARFGIFLNQIAATSRHASLASRWTLPIGVSLVLGGAVLTVLAGIRFMRVERDIDEDRLRRRYGLIYVLVAAAAVVSITLAVYLIYAQLTAAAPAG